MDTLTQLIFDTITQGNTNFSDMCVNDVEGLSSEISQTIREKYYVLTGQELADKALEREERKKWRG